MKIMNYNIIKYKIFGNLTSMDILQNMPPEQTEVFDILDDIYYNPNHDMYSSIKIVYDDLEFRLLTEIISNSETEVIVKLKGLKEDKINIIKIKYPLHLQQQPKFFLRQNNKKITNDQFMVYKYTFKLY